MKCEIDGGMDKKWIIMMYDVFEKLMMFFVCEFIKIKRIWMDFKNLGNYLIC